ncbi:MAG: N-acetylmuramoyl-L-alanine amidase [Victivallales bacterium]|nr:N-acetylmuramoyl-L-alanine amidase [Victivallales bacterium]
MKGNNLFSIPCLVRRRLFHSLLMALLLTGGFMHDSSAAQPLRRPLTIRFQNLNGTVYLYMADVAAFYGMAMLVNDKEITYKSRYSTISFTVNNRLMTLNNVQYYLARPIIKNQYSFLIGKSDFELILEPILRPTIINPKRPVRTILIDPGHGGKDVGAVNGKDYEKDINLAVALRLANKLSARGFRIYMTRNKDSELSLDKRTRFANTIDADLFISIHCNSASPSANGLETYIATPKNDPPVGSTTVYKDNCPANKYDKANAYLAFYTQRSILQRTGVADRGVRRKRYYVIRNTNCPSMLIEIGFISSNFELANLKNPVYQEKITDGIVDGVLKYREAVK